MGMGVPHSCDYLVLLFCGTLGNNDPELLGSDESDIIIIVWQLLDLVENQTGDIHYIYIRPSSNIHLSEEWIKETGISEETLQSAISFGEAIQQFEQTLRNELNSKGRTCKFFLCTDGQCHLRQVLHPTAMRQDIALPEFFHSFFDLRKEFRNCFPGTTTDHNANIIETDEMDGYSRQSTVSVEQMLEYLNITVPNTYGTLGVDHVMRMSTVVQVMICEKHNHRFTCPETILARLDTGPCVGSYGAQEECVVRARGLPWQASDHDIAKFFKGLNIQRGGVALVLNPQGRRNGEALVQFCSPEHRSLALLRHKHHMANRYIEVYRAKEDEFFKVATCNSREAVQFLSKGSDAIVRVRGLPFTAVAHDIVNFFGPEIPVAGDENGVLIVRFPDGKSSGDAFVLFDTEEIAHLALGKHKQTLGKRYIEIFKSTAAEVQQVLSQHMLTPILSPPPMASPMHHVPMGFPGSPVTHAAVQQHQAQLAQLQQAQLQAQAQVVTPPGSIRNCIRLRGMPYSATVEDIMQFLGDLSLGILPNGIHMVLNQQGRPSGDAFIQMTTPENAALAALDISKGGCHKKHMRERYVEVFQCSGDEMNMVLMGGTLNRNGVQPPPGMSLVVPDQISVQRPPVTPPIPSPFGLPGAQTLMVQPSQIPIEMLHPQAQLLPAMAGRHILAQPTLLPYAAYLPTPPVSPSIPGSAATVHTLAASPGYPHQFAIPQPAHPLGIQVRMQGVTYNPGMSDILTLFKGYNGQQPGPFYASAAAANGCQSPLVDEKAQAVAAQVAVGNGNSQTTNDWTCIM
ncbi:epithelial splicing regulatory protein 1-like [Styela clava]